MQAGTACAEMVDSSGSEDKARIMQTRETWAKTNTDQEIARIMQVEKTCAEMADMGGNEEDDDNMEFIDGSVDEGTETMIDMNDEEQAIIMQAKIAFKCDVCEKVFVTARKMKKHIRRAWAETDEEKKWRYL